MSTNPSPRPITVEELHSVLNAERFGTVHDLVGRSELSGEAAPQATKSVSEDAPSLPQR